ncbi:MAG: NUDIX hydrolase [Candidatus Thorarchaeota archaeon]
MEEKPRRQFFIVKSLIVNDEGKILLVKRHRPWHKEAHNKWEFPGGKIDFGEKPEETCIREAKEESGVDIEIDYMIPKIHIGKWIFPDRESQQIILCYKCNYKGGNFCLEDHGVSDVKWCDLKEIDTLDCLPGTLIFLEEYKKNKDLG